MKTKPATIKVETEVHAPMDKVWDYWTEPEHITGWYYASDEWEAPRAETDLRPAGKFLIAMSAKDKSAGFDFTGTFTSIIKHELIEYDIVDGRHVTIAFEVKPGGIKISETFEAEMVNSIEQQRSGWQAILDNFRKYAEKMAQKDNGRSNITTCLWFDTQAEEAADFYVKIFYEAGRQAKIGKIARYGESVSKVSGQPKGKVMTVEFEIDGNKFLGLNGGPLFKFSQATSFIVTCKNQEEIDYFWEKLGKEGKQGQCGWIDHDKFGVSWQVVPKILGKLMSDPDPARAERVAKAMLSMKKLDMEALIKAKQ